MNDPFSSPDAPLTSLAEEQAAGAVPPPSALTGGVGFSEIGEKLTHRSAILELMDDLGSAMTTHPDVLMLGGGNPAAVPELQLVWRRHMRELLAQEAVFDRMLANYEPPQGNPRFLEAFAQMMHERFAWPITAVNVAITPGTQAASFFLFNLLAGEQARGGPKKILLPLSPEYIGYADQGLRPDMFASCPARITWPQGEDHTLFKYAIDFEAVEERLRQGDIAAIAVSRPTNPTGNVITESEVQRLSSLASQSGVYLIIDGAYGVPFPGVVFTDAQPHFAPHVISTFSLSKLGLPGVRTGIVVAPSEITAAIKSWNAIVGLSNTNFGQQLVLPMVESGEILRFGPDILRPFYAERSRNALAALHEHLGATKIRWAVHASEGAFFLWLWLRDLPVPTVELYQRLKACDVLVVPGEFFFYGQSQADAHHHECLRISFAQSPSIVREGIRRLAEVIRTTISL